MRRIMLALFALVFVSPAFGQIHVSHDGVEQFCALQAGPLVGGAVNFTGTCTAPPGNDTNAYTTLSVTWMGVGTGTTDARHFETLWGKCSPNGTPGGWSGCNGATLKWLDQPLKHMRVRLHMPSNPGTLSHFFSLDSYTTTPGMNVRMAAVRPDADFPTGAATPCWIPVAVNNRPALNLNPGAPNPYKCNVAPNTDVDVLIDSSDPNARGTIGIAIN